jgi:[ribosomal protein S5]-alanine N-acetyltransferase
MFGRRAGGNGVGASVVSYRMTASVLETRRLELRPWGEADIPELLPLISAREVAATTLRIPHPYEEKHAREFLAGVRGENELRLAIRLRHDGRLCGGVGLHPEAQHNRAELGYWLGVPYWGNGYATEAATAVVRYGFEQLKLNRIFATYFTHNPASGKVLRKIGMKYEGCMRQHVLKWGEFVDLEFYSILRQEWK